MILMYPIALIYKLYINNKLRRKSFNLTPHNPNPKTVKTIIDTETFLFSVCIDFLKNINWFNNSATATKMFCSGIYERGQRRNHANIDT